MNSEIKNNRGTQKGINGIYNEIISTYNNEMQFYF